MSKLVVVALAAWLLVFLQQPDTSSASGEIRLCGRMLAEALSMLCDGRYHGPPENVRFGKRDLARLQIGSDPVPTWLLEMARLSDLHRQQIAVGTRQQRGVVDECCRKACTPSILLSYCA